MHSHVLYVENFSFFAKQEHLAIGMLIQSVLGKDHFSQVLTQLPKYVILVLTDPLVGYIIEESRVRI